MGICPRCGSWVDEGEPYCPECGFDGSEDGDFGPQGIFTRPGMVEVNGSEYDVGDVENALDDMGYDLDDFKNGIVDEDELEEILEDDY